MASLSFQTKAEARAAVWRLLKEQGLARFPFPIEGRIPNFAGAKEAADRLASLEVFRRARTVKVNPDAPQRFVREAALRAQKRVLVPTPRLRGGFKLLDPASVPPDEIARAASLSGMDRYARTLTLDQLPPVDLVVMGSVAVDPRGRRAGKGEGYADREYAVLRSLGHRPHAVVTTVHDVQVVDELPAEDHDASLDLIVTPTRVIEVAQPTAKPSGIDWSRVTQEEIEAMPILKELADRKGRLGSREE